MRLVRCRAGARTVTAVCLDDGCRFEAAGIPQFVVSAVTGHVRETGHRLQATEQRSIEYFPAPDPARGNH